MGDQEEEILTKIEQAHQAGQHLTGPQAGCRFCAERLAENGAPIGDVSAQEAIDELAQRRAAAAPSRPADLEAILPSAEEIASWGERGEPTLGDVALEDAQKALDTLEVGNYALASVHAQVGMTRALVGIDETLQRVLFALDTDDEGIEVFDSASRAALAPLGEAPALLLDQLLDQPGPDPEPSPEDPPAEPEPPDAA